MRPLLRLHHSLLVLRDRGLRDGQFSGHFIRRVHRNCDAVVGAVGDGVAADGDADDPAGELGARRGEFEGSEAVSLFER